MIRLLVVLVALFVCGTATAQPSGLARDGIRIVVPVAAGGTSDLTARILAEGMQAESGLSLIHI